ncbi:TrbC/VirB2 family protein [Falsirhodobacter sp. 1013]|uniref:TrbC/VirB2 family protein n=1 Tax=Falsirhodobacter sp. 1013 TaxID=3417566 RepID=UPI003EBBB734
MAVLTRYGQLVALALAALITLSLPALAQDLSPVNTMLGNIGDALTGATGRALGLIALAGVGIAFLIGRMNWMLAISVVVGLAILFGAGTMLDGFA